MAAIAARSFLRSSARLGSTRFAAGAKPTKSPFLLPKQKSPSSLLSRMPVEMSCAMESMLPFHTATASALLTSMLSVSPRIYNWTLEGGAAFSTDMDGHLTLFREIVTGTVDFVDKSLETVQKMVSSCYCRKLDAECIYI